MQNIHLARLASQAVELLQHSDPHLYALLEQEYCHQTNILSMVAASSTADPSVLACEAMAISNVTTEGYAGARFHAGCKFVDEIEKLAIERAKEVFHARYANVQPHSGTSANEIVLLSLLTPGDTILGLELTAGGHLSHGAPVSLAGRYFHALGYGLDQEGYIDYGQVRQMALEQRPKLIICGGSAYPRMIDFQRFREIADMVGAFLLADISHIAGLVVTGEHPSPIDVAHFTTTSTYKQLYGPRGGLILLGKDYKHLTPNGKCTLSALIQQAVFPFFQGTPHLNAIAAKARALAWVNTTEFKLLTRRIVANARTLATSLANYGHKVLTGGTDNHMVLLDVLAQGITGVVAEQALEACNIIVNKNRIPGDQKPARISSGIRLGTNSVSLREMGNQEMNHCASLIQRVLTSLAIQSDTAYSLDPKIQEMVRKEVYDLCWHFPLPHYPMICP